MLQDITNGEKIKFTLLPELPSKNPESFSNLQSWHFEDYLIIAEAFHKTILGESLEDWDLSQIDAIRDCKFYDKGYDFNNFIFFKEFTKLNNSYRSVHLINIVPTENYINITEEEYFPIKKNWKPIKYKDIKISPESALLIAEKVGGKEYRIKNLNDCRIHITLKTDEENGIKWQFIYRTTINKKPEEFQILVNTMNGNFEIIQ